MKLCFGTAQVGQSYGINNNSVFSKKKSFELLKNASDLGIHCFDTAPSYGAAEIMLGQFIKKYRITSANIDIVSKVDGNKNTIRSQLQNTLSNLGLASLTGYLLHDCKSMYNHDEVDNLISLKKEGLIKNIGVSAYLPKDAVFAARQSWVDYIQIPYNVFDQRLDKNNFFQVAKKNEKTVFARSVLLQGLLGMEPMKVSIKLPMAHEEIIRFNKIVGKYCITPIEAAVQFVKAKPEIDFLVFGVDNKEQLCSFLRIFNREEQQLEMIEELKVAFRNVDERIIMPPLWAKGKS